MNSEKPGKGSRSLGNVSAQIVSRGTHSSRGEAPGALGSGHQPWLATRALGNYLTSDFRSFEPYRVVVTTLRTDRNDQRFVAPCNRVAVFLAVTASAHINEPIYGGLRGSPEKSKNFSGRVRSVAEALHPPVFHVTPTAAFRGVTVLV